VCLNIKRLNILPVFFIEKLPAVRIHLLFSTIEFSDHFDDFIDVVINVFAREHSENPIRTLFLSTLDGNECGFLCPHRSNQFFCTSSRCDIRYDVSGDKIRPINQIQIIGTNRPHYSSDFLIFLLFHQSL